jgi:hypothetical protein
VVFLASADLALAALATPVMQIERVGGGDQIVFDRAGRTFTVAQPAPELASEDAERFARFAAPATLEVLAPEAAPRALEVAWRIERGLLAAVDVRGVTSEDLTARRESARRRSGRARIGAGGALSIGLTERTADVRLDVSTPESALGGELDRQLSRDWLLDLPLARSLVPRVLVPRVVAWPADDTEQEELALVDVQRAEGTMWRFAVNAEGRCEALLTVWPPRAPFTRLEVEAGGRVVAEEVPGRLDVVRLVGDGPFDVRVQKGPDEQFAFAVRVGDEVLDARRMRIEGRRMASDADLSLVIPGWLPGVTEGLFGEQAAATSGGSDAPEPWRVRRTDPAGLFGAEQVLGPDEQSAVRGLTAGE